jgi:PEGA domain
MTRWLAYFSLLCVLGSSAARASADVGVVVVGEPSMQPQVAAQLEAWLTAHGHRVVPAPLSPEVVTVLNDCFTVEDDGCARKTVDKHAKSQAVVFARITLDPTKPERTAVITAWWFKKKQETLADRRYCERCTDAILRGATEELITALEKSTRRGTGRLSVASTPAGARVRLDGEVIGVTPLEYDVTVGSHDVVLELDRHEIATRNVTVAEGGTSPLSIPLTELDRGSRRKLLPVALIVAGGAMLAGGVVLYVKDEDESPNGSFDIDNTAPAGVALAGAGAVTIGVGVFLLLRKPATTSGPVARASRDGGYIGWIGKF